MTAPPVAMVLHRFEPRRDWVGRKLKEVLAEAMPALSGTARARLVENGLVRRGGIKLEDHNAAWEDSAAPLEVDLRHGLKGRGRPQTKPLVQRIRVLHEDNDVLVLDKARGIVVQPEKDVPEEKRSGPPIVELVKHYWREMKLPPSELHVVQRLDKETSGLLVLAKNLRAARLLQMDLRLRRVVRIYEALVEGRPAREGGVWRSLLGRGSMGLRQSILGKGGRSFGTRVQEAITLYSVVGRGPLPGTTRVELKLETGRTHQIRIHCAESGTPVVGDKLYTKLTNHVRTLLSSGRTFDPPPEHPWLDCWEAGPGTGEPVEMRGGRLHLHAVRLEFRHPGNGRRLSFDSPAPWLEAGEAPARPAAKGGRPARAAKGRGRR
ncbi:MAG: pseudouridine synthase [Candidatus Sumerlaeia bacterium]|nr:pseudouridine synthase [Candidatus Sumerlaeia bacterium]